MTWPLKVSVLSAAMLICACGPSATGPYAGLTEYRPPGEEFLLRYLAPPWQFKGDEDGSVLLEIPAPHVTELGIDAALLPSKYSFEVELLSGNARGQADVDVATATADMAMVSIAPREIVTDSGDHGWETLAERGGLNPRNFRRVSFDRSGGVVVHIVVQSSAVLSTIEMDRMIAAFDVLGTTP